MSRKKIKRKKVKQKSPMKVIQELKDQKQKEEVEKKLSILNDEEKEIMHLIMEGKDVEEIVEETEMEILETVDLLARIHAKLQRGEKK